MPRKAKHARNQISKHECIPVVTSTTERRLQFEKPIIDEVITHYRCKICQARMPDTRKEVRRLW